jgi:hypothetical protein
MSVLSMPNILIFSFLLYLFISGEKSCMTLLIMQQIKRALLKGFGEDDVTIEEEEEKEPNEEKKAQIKFEDKYLERFKETEEKDLTPEKLDSLLNSFVMENTPQGNVVMFWDNKRDTFSYYADHLIPYRFLEVVGRKYVLMNDCRKLFVDMEEEIKTAEKKLEEKKKQKEEEEEKQKQNKKDESADSKTAVEQPKKSVFAKLKSYNRDNSVKSATVALDSKKPQTNIPKNTSVNTKQDENMILKERANRYSYQGRMVNFSFLKKVERKAVDKNYAMSFAEFKKMQKEQNKS